VARGSRSVARKIFKRFSIEKQNLGGAMAPLDFHWLYSWGSYARPEKSKDIVNDLTI